jgi:hypothetical protein
MEIRPALLVIADIGGYTRYMQVTRMSLAHSQLVVSSLLEAVLDAAPELELAKLEGDAVFFHGPADQAPALPRNVERMHAAFTRKKLELIDHRMCDCEGCSQLENLTLKFVAHTGDVAFHRIKQLVELAGVDVILVHRMLKNDVPAREYMLFTDAVRERLDHPLRSAAAAIEHDFEGIGRVRTHYVEVQSFAAPQPVPPRASWPAKLWAKVKGELLSLPHLISPPKAERFRPAAQDASSRER